MPIVNPQKHFIGKSCIHGHDGTRYISGHGCVECRSMLSRAFRDKPNYKQYHRDYYQKRKYDPAVIAADRQRGAKWRATEKGKSRSIRYYLKYAYGITVEQFAHMVAQQNNECAICGRSGTEERHGRLSVDHDHKTNVVRQLLCDDCNVGIGTLGEDVGRLEAAAAYLRRHGK